MPEVVKVIEMALQADFLKREVKSGIIEKFTKEGMDSTEAMACYFDLAEQVRAWCGQNEITDKNDQGKVVAVWKVAKARFELSLDKAGNKTVEADECDPLPLNVKQPLLNNFKQWYFLLPGLWRGTEAMLGLFSRQLANRGTFKMYQIRRFESFESIDRPGAEKRKEDLPDGRQVHYNVHDLRKGPHILCPFAYLHQLRTWGYTLVLSGSYLVGDKRMVPLAPIHDHLVAAESYVFKYLSVQQSDLSRHSAVLTGLQKIDENIRLEWARNFRDSTTEETLGEVIDKFRGFTFNMWHLEPNFPKEVAPVNEALGHWAAEAEAKAFEQQEERIRFAKAVPVGMQGKGKGNGGQKWGLGQGPSAKVLKKLKKQAEKGRAMGARQAAAMGAQGGGRGKGGGGGKGKQGNLKTTMNTREGHPICKKWNDVRTCLYGDKCNMKHVCDVVSPDGQICQSKAHNRLGHKQQ
jgi:hypothetical protein